MIEKKLKAHIYHLICKEIAGFRRPKMQKQQKHRKKEKKKEREREEEEEMEMQAQDLTASHCG